MQIILENNIQKKSFKNENENLLFSIVIESGNFGKAANTMNFFFWYGEVLINETKSYS